MMKTKREWTVLSNHGMVLFHLAANPDQTQRELAYALGITEHRVGMIIKELEEAGMVQVDRSGWRNSYSVNPDAHLRHATLSHIPLWRLIEAVRPLLPGGNGNPEAE